MVPTAPKIITLMCYIADTIDYLKIKMYLYLTLIMVSTKPIKEFVNLNCHFVSEHPMGIGFNFNLLFVCVCVFFYLCDFKANMKTQITTKHS